MPKKSQSYSWVFMIHNWLNRVITKEPYMAFSKYNSEKSIESISLDNAGAKFAFGYGITYDAK